MDKNNTKLHILSSGEGVHHLSRIILSGDQHEKIQHKDFNKVSRMCVMKTNPDSYIIAADGQQLKRFDLGSCVPDSKVLWSEIEGRKDVENIIMDSTDRYCFIKHNNKHNITRLDLSNNTTKVIFEHATHYMYQIQVY